jgi:8-oxo-dGTP pyrophosphatase MutT (NUDIX family)
MPLQNTSESNQPPAKRLGAVVALSRVVSGQVQYLLIRRSQTVPLPGKVCFPGGGVDAGEAPEAAAVREMQEELGLRVRIVQHVWTHQYNSAGSFRGLALMGYAAKLDPPDQTPAPSAAEVAEVLWLTPQQVIAHPDGLEATRYFIAALEAFRAHASAGFISAGATSPVLQSQEDPSSPVQE